MGGCPRTYDEAQAVPKCKLLPALCTVVKVSFSPTAQDQILAEERWPGHELATTIRRLRHLWRSTHVAGHQQQRCMAPVGKKLRMAQPQLTYIHATVHERCMVSLLNELDR